MIFLILRYNKKIKNMFSQLTCEKLGYYVYTLRDPFDPRVIFYVGKGTGNRVFAHLNDALESESSTDKLDFIRELINAGERPIHTIVRHGMDEKTAFEVEGALIDILGLEELKNEVNGHGNSQRGIKDSTEIEIEYGSTHVHIDDPVMIVKANHSWDEDTKSVIYDKIRCDWSVSDSMEEELEYVLVAHRGIVREVYELDAWFVNDNNLNKKGNTYKKIFEGRVAPDEIRDKYIHRDVSAYFAVPRLQKAYAGC